MKPYQTPTLTALGDVETLTGMPKGFGFGDGSIGMEDDPLSS